MIRIPAKRTTNRRMTTTYQDRPRAIEWNSTVARMRLMSRDLTAEPQSMFDSIKEPLPPGVERYRSSLSEELYKAATWDTSIDLSRFGDHRDTFAIFGLRHLQSRRIGLPDVFFERLLCHINFETYLAVRLCCRCWSEAITRVRPISTPSVSRMPVELLEKIYAHLDPVDFNAARHVCRTWMISSLEERLLLTMLSRGGWFRAAEADTDIRKEHGERRTSQRINDEWLLSKRLATECSLLPSWTGNGFPQGRYPEPKCLSITSRVDFSELSNGHSLNSLGSCEHGTALQFTVSVCQRFLLASEGCLIYVYALNDRMSATHPYGGYLCGITTIVCPHRVLAVSMDTTSRRLAVAALLENRMGIVCDISDSKASLGKQSTSKTLAGAFRGSRDKIHYSRSSNDHVMFEASNPHGFTSFQIANDRATSRAIAEATLPDIYGARKTPKSWTIDDPLLYPIEAPGFSRDYDFPKSHMPVATGPRSIYRNLCSSDDPPRSVAICPQRRCVAFGSAAGIELHWIDALTGQDLNRWFPLTAPSDFLYFLPPRPGVDSAKKLRLISSAAHPKEREGFRGKFFPQSDGDAAAYHGMAWDEDFEGTGFGGSAWRGSGWCDHYHAVSVSDGWNILFTDPDSGILCLGSDIPPGTRATKLSRRFTFTGPHDRDGNMLVARVYRCATELRWGARVIVGYGEALWLFVVASDIFFPSKVGEINGIDAQGPRNIEGIEIGKVPALIDVSIDASGGDITVWGFAADSMAYVWQIRAGDESRQMQTIARDGAILPLLDIDGDTSMPDAPSAAVHFDGSFPMVATALDWPQDCTMDEDGDVSMADAPEDEGYQSEFEVAGGQFAIHAPPLWGRWSEDNADWVPDYLGQRGSDIEDEGVGIDVMELSRIDVEVMGS